MTENKIDHRKNYILVLDIETANFTEQPLAYDVGFAVADRKGNIYESRSLMIAEMFLENTDLMQSAYYAHKIPQYLVDYLNGKREMVPLLKAKQIVRELMEKYGITDVYAYNCYFDRNGLDTTIRYLTKSRYRWFFPCGTEFHCIQHLACQTILQQKSYFRFALENELVTPKGNVSTTAESAYKYITKVTEFEESHTGLEDVQIEVKIMAKCYAQHKKVNSSINRGAWNLPQKSFKNFKKALDKQN